MLWATSRPKSHFLQAWVVRGLHSEVKANLAASQVSSATDWRASATIVRGIPSGPSFLQYVFLHRRCEQDIANITIWQAWVTQIGSSVFAFSCYWWIRSTCKNSKARTCFEEIKLVLQIIYYHGCLNMNIRVSLASFLQRAMLHGSKVHDLYSFSKMLW